MQKKFYLFVYSTPNIVGCSLALLGLLAFFTGFIRLYWFLIVAGLYLLGYVITPRRKHESLVLKGRLANKDIERELNELVGKVKKRVSQPVFQRVNAIADKIISILPQMEKMQHGDKNLHVVKQTATDYLPQMLENYLALPPAFATMHPLYGKKTAREYLIEQLDLLDQEMQEILIKIHSKDSEALITHGQFLKNKFSKGESWLD